MVFILWKQEGNKRGCKRTTGRDVITDDDDHDVVLVFSFDSHMILSSDQYLMLGNREAIS